MLKTNENESKSVERKQVKPKINQEQKWKRFIYVHKDSLKS